MSQTIANIPVKCWLRARFDYANGKTWRGLWNRSGEQITDQAWAQNKEGILRAGIEIKDCCTKEVLRAAEIPGQDFRNFQWLALAPYQFTNGVPIQGENVGLQMLTRSEKVTVFIDGSIKVEPLTQEESEINFATYGK
jgi:hypothetical protein